MRDILKENYRIMNIQNIFLNGREVFIGDYFELLNDCFVFISKIESENKNNWNEAINEINLGK